MGFVLAGSLGGMMVGIMPLLTQGRPITLKAWWVWTILNSILSIAFIALIFFLPKGNNTNFLFFWIPMGIVTALIVAGITRWLSHRIQSGNAYGWVWSLSALLLLVITTFLCFFSAGTASQ
jgi:hypothetical protein